MHISVQRGLPAIVLIGVLLIRIYDPILMREMRLQIFDLFQQLVPRSYVDAPVRVIDVNEESLSKYGQWPWPRSLIARLVDNLRRQGVAAIGFDMVFAEPDRTSPRAMQQIWNTGQQVPELDRLLGTLPDPDEQLAQAFQHARVVTGFFLTETAGTRAPQRKAGFASNGDDPLQFAFGYGGTIAGLPSLDAAAQGIGMLNMKPDRDGITRRVPLIMQYKSKIYPSLAAEALRVAQGAKTNVIRASGAQLLGSFGRYHGINEVRIGSFVIPTDRNGQVWVYDTGSIPKRLVPAWQVLEGNAPDLRGMIVLVGTSALGLKDLRATPLDPAIPGVELHAEILEQILTGTYLQRPYWGDVVEIGFLVVLGTGMLLLLPKLGPIGCALAGASAGGLGVMLAAVAYVRHGWLFDPVYPSTAAMLVYLSGSLMGYIKAELERRHVRLAFSHYLSPTMVARLAADPSSLKLGGEMRDITIMFLDIRDFTTIAEGLDAVRLTHLINEFLTSMSAAVLDHGGTIDKYIGDSLMAIWNAPLDDPDHGRNACKAALAMRRRLIDFNARLKVQAEAAWAADQALLVEGIERMEKQPPIEIRIGIGINSGICCVGNLGSEQQFNYSAMGDNVNLASRVEGLTKFYKVDIIVTEATRDTAPDFHYRNLDVVHVKGRSAEVTIFALLDDGTAPVDQIIT
ncbi:MAG TPA: adenylate/guanylate cyclase domain-containing protein [Dongiaceae bacterium]